MSLRQRSIFMFVLPLFSFYFKIYIWTERTEIFRVLNHKSKLGLIVSKVPKFFFTNKSGMKVCRGTSRRNEATFTDNIQKE